MEKDRKHRNRSRSGSREHKKHSKSHKNHRNSRSLSNDRYRQRNSSNNNSHKDRKNLKQSKNYKEDDQYNRKNRSRSPKQQKKHYDNSRNNRNDRDKYNNTNRNNNNNNNGSNRNYRHRDREQEKKDDEEAERKFQDRQRENKNNNHNHSQQKQDDSQNEQEEAEIPNYEATGILAAHQNKVNGAVLKFTEPEDAAEPKDKWRLYPYKGEEELPIIHLKGFSAFLFGKDTRIAQILTENPTCSGQHAVLQFREKKTYDELHGEYDFQVVPYIMDLESTNGTKLNGSKIETAQYYQLLHGDILTFGHSTREYIVMKK